MFHALYDIEHIIAEFLGLTHKIHEEYTFLIVVFLIIDVEDVAVAELVAEIVDLTLFVVGGHNAGAFGGLHLLEKSDHVAHRVVDHGKHLVDLMHHRLGERYMVLILALQGLRHVEASVGYRLDLADDPEHTGDAHLAFRTQTAFGHTVQIGADLDFHAVGNLLIFLQTVVDGVIIIIFLVGMYQVARHAEHPLNPLPVNENLFLGLSNVKLGGRKDTAADIFEAEFLLLVLVARRHDPAYDLYIKLGEPDHHEQVAGVEHGGEHCQAESHTALRPGRHSSGGVEKSGASHACFLRLADVEGIDAVAGPGDIGHELHKGMEDGKHHQRAQHVEEHMAHGRALGGEITAQGGEHRGDGGSDISAEDNGAAEGE